MTEKRHEEYQYLELLQNILDNGANKGDRTGIGTKSIFGAQMRFNLRGQFPILTTKKVYWKGIVEELLWFIRGETDSKKLEEKGVKIWTQNTSREFLDNHKPSLRYPEGEAGKNYSYYWRNWGGTYEPRADVEFSQKNYKDGGYAFIPSNERFSIHKEKNGFDQLAYVVEQLKLDPNSRRHLIVSWDPTIIQDAALPPCHYTIQFYVANGELSCMFGLRSNDLFLGCPFNISSYALFTYIIAELVGLTPGDLIYSAGDAHIYLNHLEQVKEQLTREPYPFPKLILKKKCYSLGDVEKLEFTDFELIDYKCHPGIKAEMAI